MDKAEHGKRLKAAIASKGIPKTEIADVVDRSLRTLTNWTSGHNMPNGRERVLLREMLGPYDSEGDAVEVALRSSELTEWRQDAVVSFYKRNLHEQRMEHAG